MSNFSLQKGTKNALETARTFATIIADMDVRQRLLEAHTEQEFMELVVKQTQLMMTEGLVLSGPPDDAESQVAVAGAAGRGPDLLGSW